MAETSIETPVQSANFAKFMQTLKAKPATVLVKGGTGHCYFIQR